MPEQRGLGSLKGTHSGSSRDRSSKKKKAATASKGRNCNYDQCETSLSIYNNDSYCSLHAPIIEVERQEAVVRRYRKKGYVF